MNSATGTRTRVARVRAEYPNQLDYSGSGTDASIMQRSNMESSILLFRTSVKDVRKGPRGLMDKASVFGTEDCRFESCRGHLRTTRYYK